MSIWWSLEHYAIDAVNGCAGYIAATTREQGTVGGGKRNIRSLEMGIYEHDWHDAISPWRKKGKKTYSSRTFYESFLMVSGGMVMASEEEGKKEKEKKGSFYTMRKKKKGGDDDNNLTPIKLLTTKQFHDTSLLPIIPRHALIAPQQLSDRAPYEVYNLTWTCWCSTFRRHDCTGARCLARFFVAPVPSRHFFLKNIGQENRHQAFFLLINCPSTGPLLLKQGCQFSSTAVTTWHGVRSTPWAKFS